MESVAHKTLFMGIETLLTLKGAAQKSGRNLLESDLSPIKDAAILSLDGKIEWIGTAVEAESLGYMKAPEVQKISLNAKTVLPSFLECHTHSIFAGDRTEEFEQRLQGMSYQEISKQGGGILSTVHSTRQASDQELLRLLRQRIQAFRAQGVSVVEVKTGYGLNVEQEIRLLRIINSLNDDLVVSTFLGAHSISPEQKDMKLYVQDLCQKALPQIQKEKLSERVDIFIESGFYTPDLAKSYFECAKALGFQITAHVEQLSHSGGLHQALQFQALSVDHCVQANASDIENLSKSDTTAVLLPSSDFYMNIPYPPARKMMDGGVRVALSTDFNPGSSPSQSVELVSVLARLQMKMKLHEVLVAWTVGAAHALGLSSEHGSLVKGHRCNFSVLDQPWTSMFYDLSGTKIKEMILNGKRVAFSQ